MKIEYSILEKIAKLSPTSVVVGEFFMSWNSVMTLAYEGFSQTLLDIKETLNSNLKLKDENPGSKWPKTTLGCMKDGAILNPEQVSCIRTICTKFNKELKALPKKERVMWVNQLSLVVFQSRTLENLWIDIPINLKGKSASSDVVPTKHRKAVRKTMAQFSPKRLKEYYVHLAPDGRSIDNYYRHPHVEESLIAKANWSESVNRIVNKFIWEIDSQTGIQGCYAWFRRDSRHLTIRALVAG